ncbi:hypothetical protein [Jonesia quinghaiensis]|uniref:hypothetical protein n=1 Tax=Jonesia quinghaiensis TaxID=262806 RepID=UPI0003FECACB|nr:hypothetical protein [Jonesia quinghaiensis]
MNKRAIDVLSTVFDYTLSAGLGVFIAVLGTTLHRQWQPYTLIVLLLAVVAATIMLRAWRGIVMVVPFGVALVAVAQILVQAGPGGDVLVPDQPVSYVWIIGSITAVGIGCFTPRSWFRD